VAAKKSIWPKKYEQKVKIVRKKTKQNSEIEINLWFFLKCELIRLGQTSTFKAVVHFLFLLWAMASIKRNANAKTRKKTGQKKIFQF
jgi:hypothetical protein